MENEFGIEKTKELLGCIFDVARIGVTLDQNGDGKISTSEIFGALTGGLIFKLAPIYQGVGDVKKEIKDFTDEEVSELVEFASGYDILPEKLDELEDFIKKLINWINYNFRFYKYTKGYFAKS